MLLMGLTQQCFAGYIESNDSVLPNIYLYQREGIKLRFVARLNVASFVSNDGCDNDLFFVSNQERPTYIGLQLRYQHDPSTIIGNDYELGLRVNRSNRVSQIDDSGGNDVDLRKLDFFVESTCFGRISLGQGRTASDRTSNRDLSGTRVATSSSMGKTGGGLFFREQCCELLADQNNPKVFEAFDNLNGFRRKMRLRYDTPKIKGFSFAISAVEHRRHDAAVRYDLNSHGLKIEAALAYTYSYKAIRPKPGSAEFQACQVRIRNCARKLGVNGSASLLFQNGFNVTIAGGYLEPQEQPRHNANFSYGKLGLIRKPFYIGETALSIDYGRFNHFSGNDNVGYSYGAAIVQHVFSWNTYLYTGLRVFHLESLRHDFNDIHSVQFGIFTRI